MLGTLPVRGVYKEEKNLGKSLKMISCIIQKSFTSFWK